MDRLSRLAGERVHARTLEMATYAVDEGRILCAGSFKDVRLLPSLGFNGRRFEAGDLHDLEIRLLVSTPDLVIEDIEVDIRTVPLRDCRELEHSLDAVKGLSIARGFTGAVKRLCGGASGCTHLVHLLTTMGPAILQGFWALQDSGLGSPVADPAGRLAQAALFLGDSCYAWRKDGEAFKALRGEETPKPLLYSYWVVPGRLLAGEYPIVLDPVESKARLEALVGAGIRLFIDLTTAADGLDPYAALLDEVSAGSARRLSFPIPDMSPPRDKRIVADALDAIDLELDGGGGAYVHCWGGIGRTGTVIGCWLKRHGRRDLSQLWKTNPKSRFYPNSPQTDDQQAFIDAWDEPARDL